MTARQKESRPEAGAIDRLRELQTAFSSHIRDPEHVAAPDGIEDRRMKIYRELFFNNIQSLLASNFPVMRALFDNDRWFGLIRGFYSEHRCQTPLFTEVAKEFLRYLQEGHGQREGDPAFLYELAHYEWVELALSLDERELDDIPADPDGDLLEGIPQLSPLAWVLSYRFPVHRIKPEFQPEQPGTEATHILVYRNRQHEVKFMQLNDVTRFLLESLRAEQELSGLELIRKVANALHHPEPDRLVPAGARLLDDLLRKDVLLGTRPV